MTHPAPTIIFYISRAQTQVTRTVGGLIVNYFRDNPDVAVDTTNIVIRFSASDIQSLYSYSLFAPISGQILIGKSSFRDVDHKLTALASLAEFISQVGMGDAFAVSLLRRVEAVLSQVETTLIIPQALAVVELGEEPVLIEGSAYLAGHKRGLKARDLTVQPLPSGQFLPSDQLLPNGKDL